MKSWNESGLNECYLGWSPEADLVVISNHHGSSVLGRVNFEGVRDHLLKFAASFGDAPERVMGVWRCEPDESGWVYVLPTSGSLVKWMDFLMIRSDAPMPIIKEAEKCLKKLDEYPVWDEDRWSDLQRNAINDYWESCSLREKIAYCVEAGLSCFAARRFPDEVMEIFYDNPDFC